MKVRFVGILLCACTLLLTACAENSSAFTSRNLSRPGSFARTHIVAHATSRLETNDVLVTLTNFSIRSTRTTFLARVPYHFIVINSSATSHEFMIMSPTTNSMSMDQMDKKALAHIATIRPGQRATLDFTFTKAALDGTLEFACHLPGHYQAGMKLGIVVGKEL